MVGELIKPEVESGDEGRTKILSLNYLGNIQYFTKLCFSDCIIDIHEHFQKQSYRNRCEILSVNGVTSLTVNTIAESNWDKATVKETRIDYSKRWQHRHWQSIVSAYRGSPFFEFLEHKFAPFYEREYQFLMDYNLELLQIVLDIMGSDAEISLSEEYIELPPEGDPSFVDFRDSISPKMRLRRPDPNFNPKPYWQVFMEHKGFIPNLSIVDLIFCKGTEALSLLGSSTRRN